MLYDNELMNDTIVREITVASTIDARAAGIMHTGVKIGGNFGCCFRDFVSQSLALMTFSQCFLHLRFRNPIIISCCTFTSCLVHTRGLATSGALLGHL
jgi:hypothetical protein